MVEPVPAEQVLLAKESVCVHAKWLTLQKWQTISSASKLIRRKNPSRTPTETKQPQFASINKKRITMKLCLCPPLCDMIVKSDSFLTLLAAERCL